MEQDNPGAEIRPPMLYHKRHHVFWTMPENGFDNVMQRHNRQVATEWCEARGIKIPF
jgi:hypothetical protein